MYTISVSERTLKLLTVLKKWRHRSNLDELVAELASKEIPSNHSASLEGGNYDSRLVDDTDVHDGENIPSDRLVTDWITDHEHNSADRNRGNSSKLKIIREPDGEYFNLIGGSTDDFNFAQIILAKIDTVPIRELTWIGLVKFMLLTLKRRGIKNLWKSYGNIGNNNKTGGGWVYDRELGLSIQRASAFESCKQVVALATRYKIPVEVKVKWREKGKYPRKQGLLRIQPGKK